MTFKIQKESFKNPGKKIKFYQIRAAAGKYFIQLTLEQHRGWGADPLDSLYNTAVTLHIYRLNQLWIM